MGRLERHGLEHGFYRAQIRRRENHEAEQRAEEELRIFKMGEPAFYPAVGQDPDVSGHVVFDASKAETRGRNADLAKRRKVVINTALEEPQDFLATESNLEIIKRNFKRVYNFAKTLKNKRRLHPQVQRILGL